MSEMEIICAYDSDNPKAIQEAIDRCPAGGTVIVPRGEWKSGPLTLKSNLTLRVEEGCKVSFSDCMEDYLPPVFTRWEGVECYNYKPLIYAKDCENITITGKGTFFGNGQSWWHWKKLQQSAANRLCEAQSKNIPPEKRVFGTREDALRPSFLQLISCKNIMLEQFCIKDGPQWTIHPVYCEQVRVNGVRIETDGPNTDGINPDSCRDVLIEHCTFRTGDDCIAINSGLNEDGWRVNRPCRQVEIRNCAFLGGHAAVAIGSGMSGGVEEVYVHDCTIQNTQRGIRLKSMRGRGGYIRNVTCSDITITNVKEEAIQVSMNYESSTAVPVSLKAPEFSDICFERIRGERARTGIALIGLAESPLAVTLKDVSITAKYQDVLEYAKKQRHRAAKSIY